MGLYLGPRPLESPIRAVFGELSEVSHFVLTLEHHEHCHRASYLYLSYKIYGATLVDKRYIKDDTSHTQERNEAIAVALYNTKAKHPQRTHTVDTTKAPAQRHPVPSARPLSQGNGLCKSLIGRPEALVFAGLEDSSKAQPSRTASFPPEKQLSEGSMDATAVTRGFPMFHGAPHTDTMDEDPDKTVEEVNPFLFDTSVEIESPVALPGKHSKHTRDHHSTPQAAHPAVINNVRSQRAPTVRSSREHHFTLSGRHPVPHQTPSSMEARSTYSFPSEGTITRTSLRPPLSRPHTQRNAAEIWATLQTQTRPTHPPPQRSYLLLVALLCVATVLSFLGGLLLLSLLSLPQPPRSAIMTLGFNGVASPDLDRITEADIVRFRERCPTGVLIVGGAGDESNPSNRRSLANRRAVAVQNTLTVLGLYPHQSEIVVDLGDNTGATVRLRCQL